MFALATMMQLKASGLLNVPTWIIVLGTVIGVIPLLGGPVGLLILRAIHLYTGPLSWVLILLPGSIPVVAEITFIVLKVMGIFTISWLWIIPIVIFDLLAIARMAQ